MENTIINHVVFTVDRACQLLGVGLCGTEGSFTVELECRHGFCTCQCTCAYTCLPAPAPACACVCTCQPVQAPAPAC
eukprot:scaffold64791_cov24-Tisochrysis_lutea.AAC.1